MKTKLEEKRDLFKRIYGALIDGKYNQLNDKEIYDTVDYCRKRYREQYSINRKEKQNV